MKNKTANYAQNEKLDRSARYLIAEFDALHQRAGLLEQRIANKINFFLALTTATTGGVLLIANQNIQQLYLIILSIVILAFLFLFGWLTYLQVLDSYYSMNFFYRRIGRIRRWFLDHDPSLLLYAPFIVGDNTPTFYESGPGLRGIETILLMVNSTVLALLAGLITWSLLHFAFANQFLYAWIPYILSFIIAILAFFSLYIYQITKTRSFLINKEQSEIEGGKIHFDKKFHREEIQKYRDTRNVR